MHHGIGHMVGYPPTSDLGTYPPHTSSDLVVATETRTVGKWTVRILLECCLVLSQCLLVRSLIHIKITDIETLRCVRLFKSPKLKQRNFFGGGEEGAMLIFFKCRVVVDSSYLINIYLL